MYHDEIDRGGCQLSKEVMMNLNFEEILTINFFLSVLLGESTFDEMQATLASTEPWSAQLDLIVRDKENPNGFVVRLWRQDLGTGRMRKTEYRMSRDEAIDLWQLSMEEMKFDDDVYDQNQLDSEDGL